MNTAPLIIAAIISLLALWVLTLSFLRAPEGHEDEAGFHIINDRSTALRPRNRSVTSIPHCPASIAGDLQHSL